MRKPCKSCGREKPPGPGRLYCRDCEGQGTNPGGYTYYKTRGLPNKAIDAMLRCKYGITLAKYEELAADQGHRCASCGRTEPGSGRTRWCVDHDHTTKVVRVLVCVKCNSSIAGLGDNAEGVRRALDYLEPPETLVDEHW